MAYFVLVPPPSLLIYPRPPHIRPLPPPSPARWNLMQVAILFQALNFPKLEVEVAMTPAHGARSLVLSMPQARFCKNLGERNLAQRG